MEVTTANDTTFLITTDLLTTFQNTADATLTVNVKVSCCLEVESVDYTTPTTYIQVETSSILGESITEFVDGIYTFTIRVTFSSGSYVEETGCIIITNDLQCKLATLIKDSTAEDTFYLKALYDSLNYTLECSECDCDRACTVWDLLKSKLEIDESIECNCA